MLLVRIQGQEECDEMMVANFGLRALVVLASTGWGGENERKYGGKMRGNADKRWSSLDGH